MNTLPYKTSFTLEDLIKAEPCTEEFKRMLEHLQIPGRELDQYPSTESRKDTYILASNIDKFTSEELAAVIKPENVAAAAGAGKENRNFIFCGRSGLLTVRKTPVEEPS